MPWLNRIPVICFVLYFLSGCAGNLPANLNSGVAPSTIQNSGEDENYRVPKQIRYSFTVTNTTGNLLEKAQFWTYLPVPETSHQKVKSIVANYPYQERRDEFGNNTIFFELKYLPPFGTRIVSIVVDLSMSDRSVALPAIDQIRFLSREPYVESDDARIVALATKLRTESVAAMAKNDFEWVARNITSEGYVAEDRGAAYAIETRKGDCTEFSYLLAALYRAQKIPARVMGGYVFVNNGVMEAMDYHNWTEFYLDGAWQIADAQKHTFVDKQSNYVAMRVIASDGVAAVPSQRFSYAGEGLRVEMN